MKLNIKERLLLSVALLPQEGDITTLRVIRDLKKALSFSEDELAKWKIIKTDNGFQWDASLTPIETEVDIEIGPKAHVIVGEALEKLSKDKKLTDDFLDLYDKFCS